MTNMAEVLRALYAAGADDIPACASCAAESTLEEIEPGVLHLAIEHQDGCPVLAAHPDTDSHEGGR